MRQSRGLFQDSGALYGQRAPSAARGVGHRRRRNVWLMLADVMGIQLEWESPESHAGHCVEAAI